MEQRGADLPFQIFDLLTKRRLADTNFGRCPREMPLLGDSQKIFDVAQFHGHLQNRSTIACIIYWTYEARTARSWGEDNPSEPTRANGLLAYIQEALMVTEENVRQVLQRP